MSGQFCGRTRRELLWECGAGFFGLALSGMLQRDGGLGTSSPVWAGTNPPSQSPLAPRPAHFPGRAKHCIFLYMYGGPSQMDLFDYKPELQKRDGADDEASRSDAERSRRQRCSAHAASSAGTARVASGAATRFRTSPSTWTSWR